MENYLIGGGIIAIISIVVGIVLFILPIILFFKLWRMTNTVERVMIQMDVLARNSNITTRHLCRDEYVKACDYLLESKGITYIVEDHKITFSDGIHGELKEVKKGSSNLYDIYGVLTDDNHILVYEDLDDACVALHEYLTTKHELQKNLCSKIEYKPKQ